MRRITPAQWEWDSLCGAAPNMLSKCPVKCLSEHAQPFPLSYLDSTIPENYREQAHWEDLQLRKGLQYPCLKQKVGLEEAICQERLKNVFLLTSEAPHGSFISSFGSFCDRQR